MGQFLNGNLYKLTAGAGFILVVAVISLGIWQWQGGDDPQQTTEASQDASNGPTLPGFPVPSDRSAVSDSTEYPPLLSGASVGDSADLVSELGRTTGDGGSFGDSVDLVTTGSAPGAIVGDGAAVGDSVQTEVQPAQSPQAPPPPPPSGGGPSEVAAVQDSAVLVVESASGEIKSQETVK